MPCDGSTRRSSPNRERRESSRARVQLAATETIRVRAATVGGDRGEAGRVCLGLIKFCARALNWAERMKQTSQAEQPNVPSPARLPPKSTTPPAPAKPLTLKDVRGKRPAEDAEQR